MSSQNPTESYSFSANSTNQAVFKMESFLFDIGKTSCYELKRVRDFFEQNDQFIGDLPYKYLVALVKGQRPYIKNLQAPIMQKPTRIFKTALKYFILATEEENNIRFGFEKLKKYPIVYATALIQQMNPDHVLFTLEQTPRAAWPNQKVNYRYKITLKPQNVDKVVNRRRLSSILNFNIKQILMKRLLLEDNNINQSNVTTTEYILEITCISH